MTSQIEKVEKVLADTITSIEEAVHRGDALAAKEWSSLAIELGKLHVKQLDQYQPSQKLSLIDESLNAPDTLRNSDLWWKWWESVDELIFLFVGLAYSFIAEVSSKIWPAEYLLGLAFVMFTALIFYIAYKSYRILSGKGEHNEGFS